jgi:hypothetical protein
VKELFNEKGSKRKRGRECEREYKEVVSPDGKK